MIALGVVLLIVGALVAYFGQREGARVAFWAGVLIAAGGAILFLLGILDAGGVDEHAAAFGLLAVGIVAEGSGGGAPHSAGDTERAEPVPRGSTPERRPVLFAFAVTATPIVVAFALAVLDATALAIPDWIPVALTGLGPLLGTLATLWAQAKVTPLIAPRDQSGDPLVPVGAAVDGPDEEV